MITYVTNYVVTYASDHRKGSGKAIDPLDRDRYHKQLREIMEMGRSFAQLEPRNARLGCSPHMGVGGLEDGRKKATEKEREAALVCVCVCVGVDIPPPLDYVSNVS